MRQNGFWFRCVEKRNNRDVTEYNHECRIWRDCGVTEFVHLRATVTNQKNIREVIKKSLYRLRESVP